MADDAGLINRVLTETSFLYGGNAGYVEELHARWLSDPGSVDPSWGAFFENLPDQSAMSRKPAWTPKPAPVERPDWLNALDGMWPAVEAKLSSKIAARQPAASEEDIRRATL